MQENPSTQNSQTPKPKPRKGRLFRRILRSVGGAVLFLVLFLGVNGVLVALYPHQAFVWVMERLVNPNMVSKISAERTTYSLWENWPQLSMHAYNLRMESPRAAADTGREALAHIGHMHLKLNLELLLDGRVHSSLLELEDGTVHLQVDSAGRKNFGLLRPSQKPGKQQLLRAEQVTLRDVRFRYTNLPKPVFLDFAIDSLTHHLHNNSRRMAIRGLRGALHVHRLSVKNKVAYPDYKVNILESGLTYRPGQKTVFFEPSRIAIEDSAVVEAAGHFQSFGQNFISLELHSDELGFDLARRILEPNHLNLDISDWLFRGSGAFHGLIRGPTKKGNPPPEITFDFRTDSARVVNTAQSATIYPLSLRGKVSNRRHKHFALSLGGIDGYLRQSHLEGCLQLTNLQDPRLNADLKGRISLPELQSLAKIPGVNFLKGELQGNLYFNGRLRSENVHYHGDLKAKDIRAEVPNIPYPVDFNDIEIDFSKNQIHLGTLTQIRQSTARLEARLQNLHTLLVSTRSDLGLRLRLNAEQFRVSDLTGLDLPDLIEHLRLKGNLSVPGHMVRKNLVWEDFDFRIDTLLFKKNDMPELELYGDIRSEGSLLVMDSLRGTLNKEPIALSMTMEHFHSLYNGVPREFSGQIDFRTERFDPSVLSMQQAPPGQRTYLHEAQFKGRYYLPYEALFGDLFQSAVDLVVDSAGFRLPNYPHRIEFSGNANLVDGKGMVHLPQLRIGQDTLSAELDLQQLQRIGAKQHHLIASDFRIRGQNLDLNRLLQTPDHRRELVFDTLELASTITLDNKDLRKGRFLQSTAAQIHKLLGKSRAFPKPLHFQGEVWSQEGDLMLSCAQAQMEDSRIFIETRLENFNDLLTKQEDTLRMAFRIHAPRLDVFHFLPKNTLDELFHPFLKARYFIFAGRGKAANQDLYQRGFFSNIQFSLDSLQFLLPRKHIRGEVAGDINIRGTDAHLANFNLELGETKARFNGLALNLDKLLSPERDQTTLNLDMDASYVNVDQLLKLVPARQRKEEIQNISESQALSIPTLDILFQIGRLKYRGLQFDSIRSGFYTEKKNVVVLDSLKVQMAGGEMALDGTFNAEDHKNIFYEGALKFNGIYIDRFFRKFNNFNLQVITEDNLRGRVNGDVEGKLFIDYDFNVDLRKTDLFFDAEIRNGKLLGFKPFSKLSKYTQNRNLDSISFYRLQKKIYLKDGRLLIPQMHVITSAGDVYLQGYQKVYDDKMLDLRVQLPVRFFKDAPSKVVQNVPNLFLVYGSRAVLGNIYSLPEEEGQHEILTGFRAMNLMLRVYGPQGNVKVSYDTDRVRDKLKEDLLYLPRQFINLFRKEEEEAEQQQNEQEGGPTFDWEAQEQ